MPPASLVWRALLTVVPLCACEETLRGQPAMLYDSDRKTLEAIVLEHRLDERAIADAIHGSDMVLRNKIVFARMAELDLLYNAYETAVLAESRKSGFALSFAGLLAGLAGGFATGEASQILSLVGGGIGALQTSYEKELLVEGTIQAFISQMRANRAAVRADIYRKLQTSAVLYPIEAALIDLQQYRQAGTLASAIVGITREASENEENQNRIAERASGDLFNIRLSDDPAERHVVGLLNGYVSPSEERASAYLSMAELAGLKMAEGPTTMTRALGTIALSENAAGNRKIALALNLLEE